MKNIFRIILVLLVTLTFISCKKQPKLHKIKYELTFHQTPPYGYSSFLELGAAPNYIDATTYNSDVEVPQINKEIAESGSWDYEYWELKDGDLVTFTLWASGGYYFDMKVYIDGVEVAHKKMFDSDVIEKSGWGVEGIDHEIEFTYYE